MNPYPTSTRVWRISIAACCFVTITVCAVAVVLRSAGLS